MATIHIEWKIPSICGAEKTVLREAFHVISRCCPNELRIDDMMTAVSEACINAMEHGNRFNGAVMVTVQLKITEQQYRFRIIDCGLKLPDERDEGQQGLEDRRGQEHPRGWGLFLIRELSDHAVFGQLDGQTYIDIVFQRQNLEEAD